MFVCLIVLKNVSGRRKGHRASILIFICSNPFFIVINVLKWIKVTTVSHESELFKANMAKCQPSVNLSEAHFTIYAVKLFFK